MTPHIHQGQPVLQFGTKLADAELAVILLHGRGATAHSMRPLAEALHTKGIHFLAPQAGLNRWYPNSAFGPLEANEPDLSAALATVAGLADDLRSQGLTDQQIAFGGFSQGACLAAEYLIRNPGRYGGLFVLSGARIGPPRMLRENMGSFDGMPVFIGGSDIDPWVSHDLLIESAEIFRIMGAKVDFRTYPGMGHNIHPDEVDAVRSMLVMTKALAAV